MSIRGVDLAVRGRPRPPSPRSARDGTCSWPAAPSGWSAPLELALEHLGALGVLGPLDLEPSFFVEVGRVVALVGVGLAAVELEDPAGDVVEEVPVVVTASTAPGYDARVPFSHWTDSASRWFGRLVEEQQVGLLEQQLAKRDPASLTAGQVVDQHLRRRAAQRVHRLVEPAVEVRGVGVVEVGLQVADLGEQLVEVGVGVAISSEMALKRSSSPLISPTASSMFWSTVGPRSAGGSCWSIPTVASGR